MRFDTHLLGWAQARRFGKPGGVRACAAFGGLSKLDQFRDLKAGCEVRPAL